MYDNTIGFLMTVLIALGIAGLGVILIKETTRDSEPWEPDYVICGVIGDMNKDWKLDITDLSILAERIRNQNHE